MSAKYVELEVEKVLGIEEHDHHAILKLRADDYQLNRFAKANLPHLIEEEGDLTDEMIIDLVDDLSWIDQSDLCDKLVNRGCLTMNVLEAEAESKGYALVKS